MRTALFSLLLVGVISCVARADFDPLLAKLPSDSNLLVMVQAEKLFASELATAEGWKQKYEDNHAEAPLALPPDAVRFVAGSRIDLPTLRPAYETAVVTFAEDLPMGVVARIVRGEQDSLAGVQAVESPQGSYLLKLDDALFGAFRPGDRQRAARWAREVRMREAAALSPYLTKASAYPDGVGTEIILALDLTDALGRESVRQAMAASPVLKEAGVAPEAAADVLSTIEGMTLGVRVTDRAFGSLRVDFGGPIDAIEPVAKELLLEVFEEAGMAIESLYEWKAQSGENGFRVSGELDAAGLGKLMSLLEIDASGLDDEAAAADDGEPRVDKYVTKEYYDGVQELLRQLKLEKGAKSYYTMASWFEKYAARIDRLPILGVDPELVDYSKNLVGQLRDCGYAIRGVGIRTGGRSSGVTGSGGGVSDGYGYGYNTTGESSYNVFSGSVYEQGKAGVRDAETQRRAIRGEERAKGSTQVSEIVRQIRDENSAIRRRMTEKHGIEF